MQGKQAGDGRHEGDVDGNHPVLSSLVIMAARLIPLFVYFPSCRRNLVVESIFIALTLP